MDTTETAEPSAPEKKYPTVRQAAFIGVLVLAIAAAGAVFVTFVFTTLIHEPASIATLAGIVVLSIGLDYGWKRGHTGTPGQIQAGGVGL